MKKTTLINNNISYEIANLGHTDKICVSDAGLPVPKNIKKIDLSLKLGIPSFLETLEVISEEAYFEKAFLSKEIMEHYPKLITIIKQILGNKCEIELISHNNFKEELKNCKAVIKSGENKWFHNIILQSGVTF